MITLQELQDAKENIMQNKEDEYKALLDLEFQKLLEQLKQDPSTAVIVCPEVAKLAEAFGLTVVNRVFDINKTVYIPRREKDVT